MFPFVDVSIFMISSFFIGKKKSNKRFSVSPTPNLLPFVVVVIRKQSV